MSICPGFGTVVYPTAQPAFANATEPERTIERRWHLFFFTKRVVIAREGLPWFGFTNGITRTSWLLANGVKVFPVECVLDEANELQELVGVPGGRPVVLSELIPERTR